MEGRKTVMTVTTTKKTERELPTARIVKKADRTKAITPNAESAPATGSRAQGSRATTSTDSSSRGPAPGRTTSSIRYDTPKQNALRLRFRRPEGIFLVVGDTGFEPVTSSVSGKRATAAPIARGGDGI